MIEIWDFICVGISILFSVVSGVGELQKYMKDAGGYMSSELACYMTYHGIRDARKLPVEFTQANG